MKFSFLYCKELKNLLYSYRIFILREKEHSNLINRKFLNFSGSLTFRFKRNF